MKHPIDWRIWLGLTLTFAWLLLGFTYVVATVGVGRFTGLPADEIGSFFEGAFAPLAFLWLVIGYFLQQKELQLNTQALRAQADQIQRSAEQAVIQSEKMAANEVHARQETFLKIADNVRAQLGTIVGFLFISSQSATADGTVTNEEQGRMFASLSQRDFEVFARRLLEVHSQCREGKRYALFYGTPVRARHSNNFIVTFERLIARATEVDPDQMIRDALFTTGHGLVYRLVKKYQTEAPVELSDPAKTGTHIEF